MVGMPRRLSGRAGQYYFKVPEGYGDEFVFFLATSPMSSSVSKELMKLIVKRNADFKRMMDPSLIRFMVSVFDGSFEKTVEVAKGKANIDDRRDKRSAKEQPKFKGTARVV